MRVIVDPISMNIIRNENPLFKDIWTFDAQNPVIGSLLWKIDIGQKEVLTHEILRYVYVLIGLEISTATTTTIIFSTTTTSTTTSTAIANT